MAHVQAKTEFTAVEVSRRSSVPDTVQHLVESIIDSAVQPGEKLPSERRLVEMLGVTRSTLRESLKTLALLGFVDIRQGDGTYLRSTASYFLPEVVSWGLLLDTVEARQLIEARRFLEINLVELATERCQSEDLEYLRILLEKMKQAVGPREFAEHDSEFHLVIARSADNLVLSSTLRSTKTLLQAWIERVVEHSESRDWVIAQHQRILSAIEARDRLAATEAMRAHMEEVTQRLQATLEVDSGRRSVGIGN